MRERRVRPVDAAAIDLEVGARIQGHRRQTVLQRRQVVCHDALRRLVGGVDDELQLEMPHMVGARMRRVNRRLRGLERVALLPPELSVRRTGDCGKKREREEAEKWLKPDDCERSTSDSLWE